MASTSAATAPQVRRGHILPALWLLILPALIAEVLSGATPPLRLVLQPSTLVTLCLYYGSGAILAREMRLRWQRGWPSVLLLGATFAIVQEGLGTKVFFDPTRTELSPLVNYGTVGGVHWVFVIQLMIYHALYSISLPILLVELLFRSQRQEKWVTGRGLILAFVCLVVGTRLLYLAHPYRPPTGPYFAAAALAALLFGFARFAPVSFALHVRDANVWSAQAYYVAGLIAGALFFLVSFGAPGLNAPPFVAALALFTIALAGGSIACRRNSATGQSWSDQHQLALAAGLLSPLIALAFLRESRGLSGSSVMGVAAAVLLIWLVRRNAT